MSGISPLFCRAALVVASLVLAGAARADTCRVTVVGDDAHSGASWDEALTLQGALARAVCTEIWVAGGVYYPVDPADRTNPTLAEKNTTFTLSPGVKLLGGFAGTETDLSQRTVATMAAHRSVLSGDIGRDDCGGAGCPGGIQNALDNGSNNTKNSAHVVTLGEGHVTPDTLIEGFTITSGFALFVPNAIHPWDSAAGLLCLASTAGSECSPTLRHLNFSGNEARTAFSTNGVAALFYAVGGGTASPVLDDLGVHANRGSDGFRGVVTVLCGGCAANVRLTNATFSGNVNPAFGVQAGAGSQVTATNATFTDQGSGVAGIYVSNTVAAQLANVLLWNPSLAQEIFAAGGANVTVRNSLVHGSGGSGGWTLGVVDGGGNIDADPLLAPLAFIGGVGPMLLPLTGSPAIDAGADDACPSFDPRGIARPQGVRCDIGAVEADFTVRRCHVASAATGASSGASWENAYPDLQFALREPGCAEIWVAAGVYYPVDPADRTNPTLAEKNTTFTLSPGVKLLGGFAGTETDLSQRTVATMAAHRSVLSGDIGRDDCGGAGCPGGIQNALDNGSNNTKNSAHVVTLGEGHVTPDTLIEGFTITSGFALFVPNAIHPWDSAAGLLCLASTADSECSPTLRHLDFSGNEARGVLSTNGVAALFYAVGGGTASPMLDDLSVHANRGSDGFRGVVTVLCDGCAANVRLTNATFSGNVNPAFGVQAGAGSQVTATNVTVANQGSGVAGIYASNTVTARLTNMLLWNPSLAQEVFAAAGTNVTLRNSLVHGSGGSGGWTLGIIDGGGNIDADPLLAPLADNGSVGPTLLPQTGSPAIDRGADDVCPPFDPRGIARPQGAHCEMGALEVAASYRLDVTTTGEGEVSATSPQPLSGNVFECSVGGGECSAVYAQDAQVVLALTSAQAWHVAGVGASGSCAGIPGGAIYTTAPLHADCVLSVIFTENRTTTLLNAVPASGVYGQSATFTAEITPDGGFDPPALVGAVAFLDDGAVIADCTAQPLAAGVATCTLDAPDAGTHHIVAQYGGSMDYPVNPPSEVLDYVVDKAMQTIDFPAQPVHLVSGGTSFDLDPVAIASSGLPVTYASLTPAVCAIAAPPAVTVLATGICTIQARQAGDDNWLEATPVARDIRIAASDEIFIDGFE